MSVSPTPSREEEASPVPSDASVASSSAGAVAAVAAAEPPVSTEPLPKVGDLVMVDLANGYKMGVVKFVGSTEFQAGDWIGVALDQPKGRHHSLQLFVLSWPRRRSSSKSLGMSEAVIPPCAALAWLDYLSSASLEHRSERT